MKLLWYLIFRLFAGIFVVFPFWLLYLISDFFYYVVFYLIRYRKSVVINNLKKAFPAKSETEIHRTCKAYYRFLTDVMVESLKGFTMSKESIIKRHKIVNPEILTTYYDQNRSVIGVSGHYGNWEWGTMSSGLQIKHKTIGFYQPLTNPFLDRFLKKTREKCETSLVSIKTTFETFQANSNKACSYLMLADQSPTNLERAFWIDFLGIDTAFLHGPEKYARLYNLPVIYIDIKPIRRGFYELELIPLTENPNELKDGELTALFAQTLEKRIIDNPKYWLWSHRRWKRSRTSS